MDQKSALAVFESLSSGVRLNIFRLLVKANRTGLVAGEIASALDIAPSSLSFHLRTLVQSGLLTVEQEGRCQRYRAELPLMVDVIGFLAENCCEGLPEGCRVMNEIQPKLPRCDAAARVDPELRG